MPNQTVFVTGAGRDIGQSIAQRLGRGQNFVIFHYSSSRVGVEQSLKELIQSGGDGVVIQADLKASNGAAMLAEKVIDVLAGRRLDILVSNAAIAAASPLGQTDLADIQAMTHVNLLAPFGLINQLAPHMNDDGSIITLSVAATQRIFSPDFAYFSATKAVVDCLVRHWAEALAGLIHVGGKKTLL